MPAIAKLAPRGQILDIVKTASGLFSGIPKLQPAHPGRIDYAAAL
jgi:hypothetical protein